MHQVSSKSTRLPAMSKKYNNTPHSDFEMPYWNSGRLVAGVDEAGRGALAGPVVAAAVVLPADTAIPGLRDSKLVPEAKREQLFERICDIAIHYGVGIVEPDVIDDVNILEATMLAMRSSVEALAVSPDHVFIDGNRYTAGGTFEFTTVVDGDASVVSIAAASIIAKVTRDSIMKSIGEQYPAYGLEKHKGYGTANHYAALRVHGPSPVHRTSFLKKLAS
jgi:ribonuclease HII